MHEITLFELIFLRAAQATCVIFGALQVILWILKGINWLIRRKTKNEY